MEPTFDTFQATSTSKGAIDLPHVLDLTKFSYARCKEIEIMKKSLASSGFSTKLAFQKLPRHMRRRAMSHNAKRLPRRLREIHLNQMKKSGLPPKQKRPSRKYRRKPRNLMEEYTKRQSRIKWLHTHIWHAKRFHMIEKWGYKLPLCPCDKSFTACYRATKKHCLLQDISYFQCVELSGSKDVLLEGFKEITNETDGLSIGSKAFVKGSREGKTTLYQYNSNPKKPIGIVEFLWKYNSNTNKDSSSSLWLWIHAAFYGEALKTLLECFGFASNEIGQYSNDEKSLELKELRTELNRFRLTGNLSNSIVQNCFKIYKSNVILSPLLVEFYESANELINAQNEYWDKLKSVTSVNILSPHIILPIIIHDPRLDTPKARTKTEPNFDPKTVPCTVPPVLGASPLWNEDCRKSVNASKVSNSEVAKLRSSLLVPSSSLTELGSPVPITLIQRPGNRCDNLGYSSGWDIVLPSDWAQAIWISLVMFGARTGGLREYQHNIFESGKPNFLYPDTLAGETEEHDVTEDCVKTYFKKPPNKRTNFNKFKIVSPFKCNWKLLIENWCNHKIENFIVIRERRILYDLQKCITSGERNISLPDNCLIPVQVQCDKGVPKQFAIICLPKQEDLKRAPVEKKCADENQIKRKKLRDQHKTMLKRLRRKRKATGKKVEPAHLEELLKYSKEMKKLWLPEVKHIKNSCSRKIIGFVRDGGFSYTLGHSKGIGYIAGAAFNALLKCRSKDKVLVRNTNSRQYYTAKLTVITDL